MLIVTIVNETSSEEKIRAALHYVADLSGTADYLYDVYFTQGRLILLRLGRKSLCRVAVGMAGAVSSGRETSILQAPPSENLITIPYSEISHLKLAIDPDSRKTLELRFPNRRSLLFLLDKNQFESMKVALPAINGLRNRLTLLQDQE